MRTAMQVWERCACAAHAPSMASSVWESVSEAPPARLGPCARQALAPLAAQLQNDSTLRVMLSVLMPELRLGSQAIKLQYNAGGAARLRKPEIAPHQRACLFHRQPAVPCQAEPLSLENISTASCFGLMSVWLQRNLRHRPCKRAAGNWGARACALPVHSTLREACMAHAELRPAPPVVAAVATRPCRPRRLLPDAL